MHLLHAFEFLLLVKNKVKFLPKIFKIFEVFVSNAQWARG